MHRRYFVPVIIACYLGLLLIFISWAHYSAYQGPIAKNGSINLSKWNFAANGTVLLNGQWSFFPNELLTPRMVNKKSKIHTTLVTVPTQISNPITDLARVSKGTYHLRLRLKHGGSFGIQTATIYSSNRLYLNGKLIGHSGRPSQSITDSKHRSLRPYTVYFPLHKGTNDLVIQFSRAVGSSSWGIAKPIILGTEQQIIYAHDKVLANDLIMVVAFFTVGLSYVGYFFQRRKKSKPLIFSALCFFFSLFTSINSTGKVLFLLFPALTFNQQVVIESTSSLGLGICILLLLNSMYAPFISKQMIKISIGFSLITFVLDLLDRTYPAMEWLTPVTQTMHTVISLLVVGYATYIFIRAVIHKAEGSLYLTIAFASMGVYAIFTTVSTYSALQLYPLFTLSSILFLLMLTLMLTRQSIKFIEEKDRLAGELIRSDQLKDQFISRTSHEFRTPLNGMINIIQNILNDPAEQTLSFKQREHLQLVTRIGYRLSSLINDILDLDKMKRDALPIKKVSIDIRNLIRSELPFYQTLTEQKQLDLIIDIPDQLAYVYADEIRVRQILNNLITNAVNYTQKGEIIIHAQQFDYELEISVQDSGVGIPPAELATIFNPYKRVNLNQGEGIGLGLAIVKQLVELQDGQVYVTSEVGKGSNFHFTLPLSAEKHSAYSLDSRPAKLPRNQPVALITPYFSNKVDAPTILVADDDLDNLSILINTLEGIPYNVIGVKNGDEALAMIAQHALDLVILDLMMPGKSGFDVCKAVREKDGPSVLPILMLTAAIVNEEKYLAFRAGANDILQKPYNYSEFAARVRGLILMKSAAAQATTMEVAFLQSQIKPHFLYNVLNSIIALSYEDMEQAREMIGQFAAYLRSSFDFHNIHSMSSFQKELALVRSYWNIEKMRFGDRMQLLFDMEDGIDFPMPPLLIQPLVEDCVQHGLGRLKKGGMIKFSVHRVDNGHLIQVSDNGMGMSPEQMDHIFEPTRNGGVGLKNVSSRLRYFYGTSLEISSALGKGTRFSMFLPQK
ncbi:MAG: ATP-binding protein [Sporolactobacillus sp.]